jgi:VIT1/CCC1 family predicted Fe2+/Mn2+ transporter
MDNSEKLDLTKPLNTKQNLKKSILVTTGSSLIGAFLFLFAYILTDNPWILAVAIILAVSGFAFAYVIKRFEAKYLDITGENNVKK